MAEITPLRRRMIEDMRVRNLSPVTQRCYVMTLEADEFIRRFLLHALPDGFHRIRHYGFLANRRRAEKLALCRTLLAVADAAMPAGTDDERHQFADHTHDLCPCCGGRMEPIGAIPRLRPTRSAAWHDSS
jgi:hypothetical protein